MPISLAKIIYATSLLFSKIFISVAIFIWWHIKFPTQIPPHFHNIIHQKPIHNWKPWFPLMSQSIHPPSPPPGNPGENFFERANPGHPGKFFCLIPCPGAKNDGRIPGDGAKLSQTRRNFSVLKLAKVLKKLRRLRDSKTTRKSLNPPALIFS